VIGLTLFAIIPSITEFYNAISFAKHGKLVEALEIASAYFLQVALLQIPALVAFSACYTSKSDGGAWAMSLSARSTPFTLVFPMWDVYAVIFSTFLFSYIIIEGKSNYFKGSMLLLAYACLLLPFLFAP